MYERFTNRAFVVMQFATEEARRFNHEYVGTEHIILGLVKEGVRTRTSLGVAAKVLQELDLLDLRKLRVDVEKVVHARADTVTKGELPQIPQARRVIEYAIEEAEHLKLPEIGTGLLLLGLVREQEGAAAQVLRSLGLNLEDMREKVLQLLRE